jgi:alpha-1,3-glucan synthase
MAGRQLLALLGATASLVQGLKYDPTLAQWNLNTNQQATTPLDYSATKLDAYTESPPDWRMPVYTLFLDKFANGDPSNDNANGTVYEQDLTSNQLRHGGDLQGLVDSLDYIQGMGIKVRLPGVVPWWGRKTGIPLRRQP